MLKNIYSYVMPDVVINRSIDELNKTRPWYDRLFGLNKYEYVDYKIIESRLFDFFVAAKDDSTEMMDAEADIIWHTFLLDTKAYRDFCKEYIGKFIDHNPYESKSYLSADEVDIIARKIICRVFVYRQLNNLPKMDEEPYYENGYYFYAMENAIKSMKGELQ